METCNNEYYKGLLEVIMHETKKQKRGVVSGNNKQELLLLFVDEMQ